MKRAKALAATTRFPITRTANLAAGAGMLFFQHQMGLLYGEARYADLCEGVLYNALLSDVDLSGKNFTYTNALETDEARYRWHVCPCCVGNIPRTILSLPTWMYTRQPME